MIINFNKTIFQNRRVLIFSSNLPKITPVLNIVDKKYLLCNLASLMSIHIYTYTLQIFTFVNFFFIVFIDIK